MTQATTGTRVPRIEGPPGDDAILEEGKRVLRLEADAVSALIDRLDASFVRAVRLLHESSGRTIVSGIGKSGIWADFA